MRITRDGKNYHTYFDRWGEFVEQSKELGKGGDASRGQSGHYSEEWSGTNTFQEATDLAERGWVEGAQLISRRIELLTENLPRQTTVKELAWSRTGPGMLNRHRYVTGRPRPYQVWRETDQITDGANGKVVKVVFNGAASAGVNTEVIRDKGILTCGLLDTLEHLGYNAELVVTFVIMGRSGSNGGRNTIEVLVKHTDDFLDLDKIAFACAHPASLRRLAFSVWEQQPADIVKQYGIGSGYGQPTQVAMEEGVVYIPEIHLGEVSTPEAQMELIRTTLAKVGVTFDN